MDYYLPGEELIRSLTGKIRKSAASRVIAPWPTSFQETLRRQLTFGLHVHVGVESADAAIKTCDQIRDHLPILLALSANSPFWCGRATGLQSHRIEVMGSLPVGGIPPRFGDWGSY